MSQVLEYIVQHYAWFLCGAILVLLAIIGYYADKTNFGQGKNEELQKEKTKDITNMRLGETLGTQQTKNETTTADQDYPTKANDLNFQKTESNEIMQTVVNENLAGNEVDANQIQSGAETEINNLEHKKINKTAEEVAFDKFKEEFDSVLPQKDIITTDLLSDIDELEFEKTQKINLDELPDLDDIELPKIKNLVGDEQDIWKF